MKAKTLGESRVRTEFNPGNNDRVQNFKENYARLINDLDELNKSKFDSEQMRLLALALTTLEESAMWAVKLLTYNK